MGTFMSTLLSRYQRTQKPDARADRCAPVCPACGGLECLCRPRFFPGQLLTDEDLTLLEDYVVKKNRLHNRYLNGWGVVCGLEVMCSQCDNTTVTVRPGYALSPCGNDIVVCAPAVADICALINRCRRQEPNPCAPGPGANPAGAAANDPCAEGDEEWILSICYEEKQSRGITPLKASAESACCSKCSCGGSGNSGCGESKPCGCGGGNGKCSCGSKNGKPATAKKSSTATCEPTLICEGYSFRVCRKPDRRTLGSGYYGEMEAHVLTKMEELRKTFIAVPIGRDEKQLRDWHSRQKQIWVDYLGANPAADCELRRVVDSFELPAGAIDFKKTLSDVAGIRAQFLKRSICAGLIPPCPCPPEDDCVPIAVVTVHKPDCRVVRICSLAERKFAPTAPNLVYWFSLFFPGAALLWRRLEALCCRPVKRQRIGDIVSDRFGYRSFMKKERTAPFTSAVLSAVTADRFLTPEHLILSDMGVLDENDQPFAGVDDLANPLHTVMAYEVGALLQEMLPIDWKALGVKVAPRLDDSAELRDKVFEMKEVIEEQKKTIDELIKRLDKK